MLVEVQLESGECVEESAVCAAHRLLRVVIAAQHAQRGKSVANARALTLVLFKQCFLNRGAAPLECQTCREEHALLACESWLELPP